MKVRPFPVLRGGSLALIVPPEVSPGDPRFSSATIVSDGAEGLVVRDLAPLGPVNPKRFIRFKANEP